MKFDAPVKAICYLGLMNDERNKVYLTEKQLIVIKGGKPSRFDLSIVEYLSFNLRKLMLPFITGGILFTFSLISVVKNFFNPYLVLITLMTGFFLMYLGWMGQKVFSVQTNIKAFDFSIPDVSENLKAFVQFTNGFLKTLHQKKSHEQRMFYLVLPGELWQTLKSKDKYRIYFGHKFTKGFTYNQMQLKVRNIPVDYMRITIDPFLLDSEVRFLKGANDQELFPYFTDGMNQSAIQEEKLIS
ncbi:MAG: hypothetical protein ACNS62_12875 [Candidatus Cyclobacteriaceae bacterium M3_2C_046]